MRITASFNILSTHTIAENGMVANDDKKDGMIAVHLLLPGSLSDRARRSKALLRTIGFCVKMGVSLFTRSWQWEVFIKS
jgi:hypothetical protein